MPTSREPPGRPQTVPKLDGLSEILPVRQRQTSALQLRHRTRIQWTHWRLRHQGKRNFVVNNTIWFYCIVKITQVALTCTNHSRDSYITRVFLSRFCTTKYFLRKNDSFKILCEVKKPLLINKLLFKTIWTTNIKEKQSPTIQ